jgi:DNA invertase Pin-like site-specific DNA recombinase
VNQSTVKLWPLADGTEEARAGVPRQGRASSGPPFGRPRKLALDQDELAGRLVSEGKSVREIASVFNVHPATIYRLAAIHRPEWLTN